MKKPLENIKVLDFSRVLSGPFCTQQLADMGARVIKVEAPHGDDTRHFGPPFLDGESTYFLSLNRGKESLCLDLSQPHAQEIAATLVAHADVLIENFRPGVAAKLGLDRHKLCAKHPRLIYASISGFGQTGIPEMVKKPGYDIIIQGLSGIPSLTGDPLGPPYRVGVPIADLVSGLYATQAILLALYAREHTGLGQYLDISMRDTQLSLLTYQAGIYFATHQNPKRHGNHHPSICPYGTFEANDGHFTLAIGNDAQFRTLADLLQDPSLYDETFATNASRVQHRETLESILAQHFATQSTTRWLACFDAAGLPAGRIASVAEALEDPQTKARDMVVTREHPKLGPISLLGSPLKLSHTPVEPASAPPLLGEHSRSLLREFLALSDAELDDYQQQGVFGPSK